MADEGIILPEQWETTAALTTPIGDHLVRKMIQAYEGSFAKGVVPSTVATGSEKEKMQ